MTKDSDSQSLGDLIRRFIGYATATISFVATMVNFILLVRGHQTVTTVVLLTTAVVVFWTSLLYLRLAKVEFKRTTVKRGRETLRDYRYSPPVRVMAIVGIVTVPLLVLTGYVLWRHLEHVPGNKFIILVADFESVDGQNYGATQQIIERLRSTVREYPEADIQPLNRVITVKDGSDVARELGKQGHAAIVLWGWCQKSQLTVHFDLLVDQLSAPPLIQDKETLAVSGVGLDESFIVQTQVSSDMSYLALLTIGLMRFRVGDNDGAIARWQKALTLQAEPDQIVEPTRMYRYIGEAYLAKGDFSPAISHFSRAIELDSRLAAALIDRGAAYYLSGNQAGAITDSDEAIKLINEHLREYPDDEQAYYDRGICYYHKNDKDRAIADYTSAIRLRPDFVFAFDNRAGAYFDKRDYESALADLNESIRLAPNIPTAYFSRGNVLSHLNRYELAIADYTQALQLDPDYVFAYDNRAYAYDHIGNSDQALGDYTRVIEIQPRTADPYDSRGLFYASKGALDLAIADFTTAISFSPSKASAFLHRGMAYSQKRELDEALRDLEVALTLKPNYSQAFNYRGIVLGQKGKLTEAVADFTRAIQLDPANTGAFYNRSHAYQELGQIGKAEADRLVAQKLELSK